MSKKINNILRNNILNQYLTEKLHNRQKKIFSFILTPIKFDEQHSNFYNSNNYERQSSNNYKYGKLFIRICTDINFFTN